MALVRCSGERALLPHISKVAGLRFEVTKHRYIQGTTCSEMQVSVEKIKIKRFPRGSQDFFL